MSILPHPEQPERPQQTFHLEHVTPPSPTESVRAKPVHPEHTGDNGVSLAPPANAGEHRPPPSKLLRPRAITEATGATVSHDTTISMPDGQTQTNVPSETYALPHHPPSVHNNTPPKLPTHENELTRDTTLEPIPRFEQFEQKPPTPLEAIAAKETYYSAIDGAMHRFGGEATPDERLLLLSRAEDGWVTLMVQPDDTVLASIYPYASKTVDTESTQRLYMVGPDYRKPYVLQQPVFEALQAPGSVPYEKWCEQDEGEIEGDMLPNVNIKTTVGPAEATALARLITNAEPAEQAFGALHLVFDNRYKSSDPPTAEQSVAGAHALDRTVRHLAARHGYLANPDDSSQTFHFTLAAKQDISHLGRWAQNKGNQKWVYTTVAVSKEPAPPDNLQTILADIENRTPQTIEDMNHQPESVAKVDIHVSHPPSTEWVTYAREHLGAPTGAEIRLIAHYQATVRHDKLITSLSEWVEIDGKPIDDDVPRTTREVSGDVLETTVIQGYLGSGMPYHSSFFLDRAEYRKRHRHDQQHP